MSNYQTNNNFQKKPFSRGQTQILYRYLPGAIFRHDDFGLCKVEKVETTNPEEVNKRALFDALSEYLGHWERESFKKGYPDPRDFQERKQYTLETPREILFKPFPAVMECLKCGHVFAVRSVQSMPRTTPSVCPREGCGGHVHQLGYFEVHNCGRIEEIFIPKGCSEHGAKYLKFYDPGRVQRARWVCGICGKELQKTRMTPCKCAYSDSLSEINRPQSEGFLKVYPQGEPGLFLPHVIVFINFSERDEETFSQLPESGALLLARLWGLLDTPVKEAVKKISRLKTESIDSDSDTMSAERRTILELQEELRRKDPQNPLLQKPTKSEEENVVDRVKALLSSNSSEIPVSRKIIEHIALKDNLVLTDIKTVANRFRNEGETEKAKGYEKNAVYIMGQMGIHDIQVVEDFPLAMATIGYTRVTKDPRRSVLRPFPVTNQGKVPLYILPTETEGLWFHLNPIKVLNWLLENGLISVSETVRKNRTETWAFLYDNVLKSGFAFGSEPTAGSSAIFTLIHSMSHLLLRHIEWSGFSSDSIGEYLMPETLSFVLYANRFAESKIGGLTTLFEQRLSIWLEDILQCGRDCIYDPLCLNEGGSCAGCLYREYNCPFFNKSLSRSVLYGGNLLQNQIFGSGVIEKGFWSK